MLHCCRLVCGLLTTGESYHVLRPFCPIGGYDCLLWLKYAVTGYPSVDHAELHDLSGSSSAEFVDPFTFIDDDDWSPDALLCGVIVTNEGG